MSCPVSEHTANERRKCPVLTALITYCILKHNIKTFICLSLMYTARVMSRSATEYNQVHLLDCTYVLILDIEFNV